jgi:DNA-binding IclR family transcriptional regulator
MARPAPGADRAVAVLELMAGHPDQRFTLSEVARRCVLNKATAHALLSALSERGVLLRHPEDKRYSLGPRLIAFGEAARHGYTAVDFAPPALDRLAAATGLWARAWRPANDHLVCVGSAGEPADVAHTARVGPGDRVERAGRSDRAGPGRVPLVPPLGAVFMAWSDGPTVEAWLARAGTVEAVGPAVEALPDIRAQGVAVTLTSPAWQALVGGGDGAKDAGRHDPGARRALLREVSRQSLLVPAIDESAAYRPADIAAPVFGSDGEVVLSLSVTCSDDGEVPGAELRALARQVSVVADSLTATVRGVRP